MSNQWGKGNKRSRYLSKIFIVLILLFPLNFQLWVNAEEEEIDDENMESVEEIKINENVLNSPDGLDKIIDAKINDDIWESLKGELPCVIADNSCINQLQNLAVNNNYSVKTLEEKIAEVNERIESARSNNQQSILWSQLSPFIQYYLNSDRAISNVDIAKGQPTPPGPIERLLGDLSSPLRLLNNILSLVGVPFFTNSFGGSAEVQQRQIAIGDLQIKVAELQRNQTELKQAIRDKVAIELLALDDISREFQVSQEIGKRDKQRLEILTIAYRFGEGNSESYLSQLSSFDRTKATIYRNWAKLRSQIVKLNQLVFDQEEI
ncbi:hypothetical protein [Geminocystis sp. NIES-3709]|uniref:hypothetical protein n=1 Tax=Geminocystis sp. NIES-3709 TaxID=1617448 RepID=UPI0005FCC621|nr:hypothetical protein [Geminocystis sp. NIES-3709]BAQ63942.1 hypothetical protein GM3709_707 [Geminocystis sp. NIES-3709]